MNKQETAQIITLLAGNYSNIAEKTKEQKQIMLNTWQECLGDLEYKLVLQAVKMSIINSQYPPTIHEIRKNAIELTNKSESKTAIEAWNEAYSMICNGLYMTEEQFKKASPEVQSFFGNVRQVAELSRTDIDVVNTVTKGQFLKQYDILINREKEKRLLPESLKEFREKLLKTMDIKQIGE